ncbi:MAG: hypothetical protein PHF18_03965 [Methanosarcina sp.]|uniref:hypothetical protein n=1 Tax=Methanosarcina sp. TaxID=2213 RepID=UPI0026368549|nr:hypothetical protein [Methanosarcina sp.]MDD3246005.1 hypothetical protein [Methanosarcina sp.]
MSVIGKSINSIINIVFLIVIFNFVFLIVSVPVAGFITGEEVLSASMGLSHDIDESVMLTEDEPVTFMLSTLEQGKTELLNIAIVDPQNKEYSWQKGFGGYDKPGEHIEFSTVFIPESSGIHQIRINNANFNTNVKLVSGMTHPTEQPLFFKTMIISTVLMVIGAILFGASTRKVPLIPGLPVYRTVTTGRNRMRRFTAFETLVAISASLYIVYNVAFPAAL